MITQDDIDAFAPEWVESEIDNEKFNGYRAIKGQLRTKDGRRTGNAVVVAHTIRFGVYVTKVITDAGNIMFLTENEMVQLFYVPKYVMTDFLPGVYIALEEEAESNA